MKNLLFLGYDETQTRLIDLIKCLGWHVTQCQDPVTDFSEYDLVVSFGYKHILKEITLETAKRPIVNLHISYLPFNRGAHPVFWAAYDNTPFGVTIHEIDTGVDTGSICFQKEIKIDEETETFASGYKRHIDQIETLFEENVTSILGGSYSAFPQKGEGSVKRVRDLPVDFNWSDKIAPTIIRMKQNGDV